MRIQKSAEDYLEAVLAVTEDHGYCRSIELAEYLGVTKPSVSYAVKRLRENGYLAWNDEKHLSLTESGRAIAYNIYTRHKKLTDLFIAMGVSPVVAKEDACKIEHDISDETFDAICRYTASVKDSSSSERACKKICSHPRPGC